MPGDNNRANVRVVFRQELLRHRLTIRTECKYALSRCQQDAHLVIACSGPCYLRVLTDASGHIGTPFIQWRLKRVAKYIAAHRVKRKISQQHNRRRKNSG